MPTELTPTQLLEIQDNINDSIERHSVETLSGGFRNHLGISGIGDNCWRKIYYAFHWMKLEVHEGRMLRLFARGHREESRFIGILQGIGFQVKQHDENGKQFRVSSVNGHYGGSCDGVAITPWSTEPFLLEFKTHNTKSFVNLIAKGLHKAKPMHIDQMSGYGYKMNLHYGIYFPENKNDDDIKVTVVKLDHNRGAQLERKAEEIIYAKEPPARISDNPAFFDCSYCHFKGICHDGEQPQKNCRSCRMSSPVDNAMWNCSRHNAVIPVEFVAKGCQDWNPI